VNREEREKREREREREIVRKRSYTVFHGFGQAKFLEGRLV